MEVVETISVYLSNVDSKELENKTDRNMEQILDSVVNEVGFYEGSISVFSRYGKTGFKPKLYTFSIYSLDSCNKLIDLYKNR